MERKEFLYDGEVLQTEEFDALHRKRCSTFQIIQGDTRTAGTQALEYDAAGNITKRTVTHMQNEVQETKECIFSYDAEGKIVSYEERLYQTDAEPAKILHCDYRYVRTDETDSTDNGQAEYLVYRRNVLRNAEEKLAFRLVQERSQAGWKQLYYLPHGAPAFQKNSFLEGAYGSCFSPTGGKWLWSLADIDRDSATVCLYETVLTYEIFCEIVDYCKAISPALDFISFSPECFAEPVGEVERMMERCQKDDVGYGIY